MDAFERFARLLERDDAEIDLGRAALLLAQVEYPTLDVDLYLCRFDDMAGVVSSRLGSERGPGEVVGTIAAYLHGELGFQGNAGDYYDPRNSYLNDVLDRRLGIPITLAVLYLQIGERLGLPFEGIGMPGHFLLRYADPLSPLLVDPFASGVVVGDEECRARMRSLYGEGATLHPSMLAAVGVRSILFRMLTNLKHVYVQRQDLDRAARTAGLLLAVDPAAVREYRDRGLVRFRAGDLTSARSDLEHYLELAPDAVDANQMREQLGLIERLRAMRN